MKNFSVQFFGLPAVGKTTILKSLIELHPNIYRKGEMQDSLKDIIARYPLLVLKSIFDVNFIFFLFVAILIMPFSGVGMKFTFQTVSGCLLNLSSVRIDRLKYKDDKRIILWDEMFSQRIYSLFGYSFSNPPAFFIRFLLHLSDSTMRSIHLSTGSNYRKRLFNRGLTDRMINFNDDEIEKIISNHLKVYDIVLTCSRNNLLVDDVDICSVSQFIVRECT